LKLDIELFPTVDGTGEVNLDFGELEAGKTYGFELEIKNKSKFDFTAMKAKSKHVLMKLLNVPESINAGDRKSMNIVISIPSNIMEAVKPDMEITGTFILR